MTLRNALNALSFLVMAGSFACQKHEAPKSGGAQGGSTATQPAAVASGAASSPGVEAAAPAANAAPKATGTVSGKIKLQGTPEVAVVDMLDKAECKALHGDKPPATDSLVAGPDGGLRDVVVFISKGAARASVPKEPAVIDQKGCFYAPHVFVIHKGQNLEIRNSDAFLHNVNCLDGGFNESMPNVGKSTKKSPFNKLGEATFQCSVHPWMRAFAYVVDNPYAVVTSESGDFAIPGVPVGKYTLSIWHERVRGLKAPAMEKIEIEVKANEDTKVDFGAYVYEKQ